MSKNKSKRSNRRKAKSDGEFSTASADVQHVRPKSIIVKGNFGKLDEKTVSDLAESIKEVGLLHPPTVYIKKPTGDEAGTEKLRLVAGQHRLAAVKKLGWEFIDVIIVKRSKKTNRKRQVTENLHRKHMTKLQEGEQMKEWLQLCGQKGGHGAQPHDKGVSRAAKKFRKSNKSIRRLVAAGSLAPDAKEALTEAGLDDNQKIIMEVAEEKPKRQAEKVKEIVRKREKAAEKKARHKESTKNAEVKSESGNDVSLETPFDRLQNAWENSPKLRKAWKNAPAEDRQRFINKTLMANTKGAAANDNDEWDELQNPRVGAGLKGHT